MPSFWQTLERCEKRLQMENIIEEVSKALRFRPEGSHQKETPKEPKKHTVPGSTALRRISHILQELIGQFLHCEATATWQATSLHICTEKILLHKDGRRESCKSKKIMMVPRDGRSSEKKSEGCQPEVLFTPDSASKG